MQRVRIISIILAFVLLCLTLSSCETSERIAYPEILDYETGSEEDFVVKERADFFKIINQECAYYQLSSLITSDAINKTCSVSVNAQRNDGSYAFSNFKIPNFYTSIEDKNKTAVFNGYSIRFELYNSEETYTYTTNPINDQDEFNYAKSVLDTLIPFDGELPFDDYITGTFFLQLIKGKRIDTYKFYYNGYAEKNNRLYKLSNVVDYCVLKIIAEKYEAETYELNLDLVEARSNYKLCVLSKHAKKHYDADQAKKFLTDLPLKDDCTEINIADGITLEKYINDTRYLTDDAIILTKLYNQVDTRSTYYLTKEGRLIKVFLLIPNLKLLGYTQLTGYNLCLVLQISQPIFDYDALLALISD